MTSGVLATNPPRNRRLPCQPARPSRGGPERLADRLEWGGPGRADGGRGPGPEVGAATGDAPRAGRDRRSRQIQVVSRDLGEDCLNMAERSDFVSPRQAAELLAVSRRSVYRYIAAGRLRAVRVGVGRNAPLRVRTSDLVEQLRLPERH